MLIGLGAGSLAKFIYRYLPECRITAVEINPQVEYIARQYFKLPDDLQRLRVVIEDGAEYMLRGESRFDSIMLDGFDEDARAGALDTLPFYQACRARLSDNGILTVNLLGRSRGFQASVSRIASAFDGRVVVFSFLRQRQYDSLRLRRNTRRHNACKHARTGHRAQKGYPP